MVASRIRGSTPLGSTTLFINRLLQHFRPKSRWKVNPVKLPGALLEVCRSDCLVHAPGRALARIRVMKPGRLAVSLLGALFAGLLCARAVASDADRDTFVSGLLGRMTLEEKIGQLNLLSAGFGLTGPVASQ